MIKLADIKSIKRKG